MGGYVATGLDRTNFSKGQEGCNANGGCGSIRGHMSRLSPNFDLVWNTPYNNFPGGTAEYAGLSKSSEIVILTECFGLTSTIDSNGNTNGFVAACGQGIEGCQEYFGNTLTTATLNQCKNDPRRTWRGTGIKVDLDGNLKWYSMNNARAFEHVSRAANGKLTFVTDNPSGFGFHSLQIENDSTPPVTNPPVTNPPVTNPPATDAPTNPPATAPTTTTTTTTTTTAGPTTTADPYNAAVCAANKPAYFVTNESSFLTRQGDGAYLVRLIMGNAVAMVPESQEYTGLFVVSKKKMRKEFRRSIK